MDVRERVGIHPVRILAVAAALTAAVTAAGCGRAPDAGTSPDRLAPLRLSGTGSSGSGVDTAAGRSAVDGTGSRPGLLPRVRYRLAGPLPEGPADAAVHRPRGGELAEAAGRLAEALRVGAAVRSNPKGWSAQGRAGVLRVARDTGAWTFLRHGRGFCPPVPADPADAGRGDAVVSCAAATHMPAPVPAGAALAVARPVLAAAGLGALTPTVQPGSPTIVRVDPVVAGLPTAGYGTEVGVDKVGVSWAHGWLGHAESGRRYPIVSAQRAFAGLVGDRAVEPLIACDTVPAADPRPGAPKQRGLAPPDQRPGGPCPIVTRTVTGARLGLLLAYSPDGPLLVPAWHFVVERAPDPVVQIAVDPRFLADAGGPGGSGGGSGGSGGSAKPAPQPTRTVPPQPSRTTPAVPTRTVAARVASVTSVAGGWALEVRAAGGGPCGTWWQATATESRHTVTITLRAHQPTEGAHTCELPDPQAAVKLTTPLGARAVLDALTGRPVRVTTGAAR